MKKEFKFFLFASAALGCLQIESLAMDLSKEDSSPLPVKQAIPQISKTEDSSGSTEEKVLTASSQKTMDSQEMNDSLAKDAKKNFAILQGALFSVCPPPGSTQPQAGEKNPQSIKKKVRRNVKIKDEKLLNDSLKPLPKSLITEKKIEGGGKEILEDNSVKVNPGGFKKKEINISLDDAPPGVMSVSMPKKQKTRCKHCSSIIERNTEDYSKNYKSILSLDGGGIRGYMQALWLDYLEKKTNRRSYELFDRIEGTSIGGIIALALTFPTAGKSEPSLSMKEILDLFTTKGDQIFPQSNKHNYMEKFWNKGKNVYCSLYDSTPLENLMKEYFGKNTLDSLLKPVGVVSVNTLDQEPVVLDSTTKSMKKLKIWEAARATSAAPTYFKAYPLAIDGEHYSLTDGGLYRNNPSTLGVIKMFNSAKENGENLSPNNMVVLSLGTGQAPLQNILPSNAGLLDGAKPIIDTMMHASSIGAHELMKDTFPSTNYTRINPRLYKNINLAKATKSNLLALETAAGLMYDKIDDFVEESNFRHILDSL